MSGGPVFDSDGRVIGLHGQGEFGFAQTSSGEVAPIKTGFNAAVPINTFIAKLVAAGINKSELKVDNTPATQGPYPPLILKTPKPIIFEDFRG